MRRRAQLVVAALILLVAGGIWLDPTQSVWGRLRGESFYNGRPTSHWREALNGPPLVRASALKALETPQAVDVLRELVRDIRSDTSDAEARFFAVELLGQLGPDARSATPELIAILHDPDPHLPAVAAATLPKIDAPAEQAIPALVSLLDTPAAIAAARALSTYKAQAKEALPELLNLMNDTSRETEARWNAIRTIGKIGPDAAPAVPALIPLMQDPEPTIRDHAAEALGDIGPQAAPAIPAMLTLLDDAYPKARREAARSLGKLGSVAKDVAPNIVKLLDDPEELVRRAAQDALSILAPELLPKKSSPATASPPAEEKSVSEEKEEPAETAPTEENK